MTGYGVATGPFGCFANLSVRSLREIVETNLVGAMLCAQQAISRMSTRRGGRGGSIVSVSSGAASHGSAGTSACSGATKGALETLTTGLAQEVAGEWHPRQHGRVRLDRDLHGQPGRGRAVAD
jgi:NAD(P)-dependent dehydrogenase (short-subunit alcohol dehydrogenase family)